MGRLGRVLKKYLLEDNNHPVAQTYRNAMKGLAKLSDGPTQWLFGDLVQSDIDLRLSTHKAGMHWNVTLDSYTKLILGYEQAVFADRENSAVFFSVSHSVRPRR